MAKQENISVAETSTEKTSGSVVPKKEREQTFAVSTLRDNCVKLFECTTSTFDGAFFDAADKEYSIEEARVIIKKWLGKELK